jgi:L-Ala-D/L-Glu epimerase
MAHEQIPFPTKNTDPIGAGICAQGKPLIASLERAALLQSRRLSPPCDLPATGREETFLAQIVTRLDLHLLRIPLNAPYKLSFASLAHFDAIVVEAFDGGGRSAPGESTIQPGYTNETLEGAWGFATKLARELVGLPADEAAGLIASRGGASPNAASALATAIEGLPAEPAPSPVRAPLVAPVRSEALDTIPEEIENLLAEGYRTLKVKAGFDVNADLRRIASIRDAVAGRAVLRVDANGGYSRAQGLDFATRLSPEGVELLEQPCAAGDWDANAAVATRSLVPVMLDESIYGVDDIERAAGVEGIRYIKLKLKKIGSPSQLEAALERIRANGLTPVLGDGTGTDIAAWHEALVAARAVDNAGEMNGFLKIAQPLLSEPPHFCDGHIEIEAGKLPRLDLEVLARWRIAREAFD